MKVTSAAFGALALASIDPRALLAAAAGDHAVLYSWVQYTGADYEGCAQTDGANSQTKAPGCHWTAEVRAIVDDPEGELTECPGGILKVNGEYAYMEVRVMAEANFANMVSGSDDQTGRPMGASIAFSPSTRFCKTGLLLRPAPVRLAGRGALHLDPLFRIVAPPSGA